MPGSSPVPSVVGWQQNETTTGGATVAQHTYQYSPDGDTTSAETLISATTDPGTRPTH